MPFRGLDKVDTTSPERPLVYFSRSSSAYFSPFLVLNLCQALNLELRAKATPAFMEVNSMTAVVD